MLATKTIMHLLTAVFSLIGGLLAVTLIDTVGAWASRRFRFNYVILSGLSFGVYIFIGSYISKQIGFSTALLINFAVAFYDATVGWYLCQKCKANIELPDGYLESITTKRNLTLMLGWAILLTCAGYYFNG